jgi:hypothetical protein
MGNALASARVPDWSLAGDGRWEAPYVHQPGRRVAVVVEPFRKGVRIDVLTYRTEWRRARQSTVLPSADDAQVADAFAQAAKIAFAR